jgi:hypothetical protein
MEVLVLEQKERDYLYKAINIFSIMSPEISWDYRNWFVETEGL